MMEFIANFRDLAEFIYFLTGPFLVIGVVIAIFQLKAFRSEATTRFSRESIQISLSLLDRKLSDINKMQVNVWSVQKKHNIGWFNGRVDDLNKDGISQDIQWINWMNSEESREISDLVFELLNEVENFTHYIYSGLVDEQLCFELEGSRVLKFIDFNKQYIAYARESNSDTTYNGIVRLYEEWSAKEKHTKLISARNHINNKIDDTKLPQPVDIIGRK